MGIEPSVVVIRDQNRIPIGTGFLVSPLKILTCAHVVTAALGISEDTAQIPTGEVNLAFPLISPIQPLSARVVFWDLEVDMAGLELSAPPPAAAQPAPLVIAPNWWGHPFRAFGFPAGKDIGVWASGTLESTNAMGWLQINQNAHPGYQILPGFSGGPVWDEELEGVAGMVIAADTAEEVRNSFMIPADVLCAAWQDLSKPLGKLHGVPALTPSYVPRPEYFDPIRSALLNRLNSKIGIAGMGGMGKSVLSASLARDEAVRRAFPDGIIWLTMGQTPALTVRQSQLAEAFGEKGRVFQDAEQGRPILAQLLKEKTCLLILDDVWAMSDLAAFDCLGRKSQLLFTTRDTTLISAVKAENFSLSELSSAQALTLLAESSGVALEDLPSEASKIAEACDCLPLALAMIGTLIRDGAASWADELSFLGSADLDWISHEFPDYPYPDLLRSIQVSVDALPKKPIDLSARYLDLAVFPEDATIPETILQVFWEPLGLKSPHIHMITNVIVNRALANRDTQGRLILHNLQYDYLRNSRVREEGQAGDLPSLHNRLLAAYVNSISRGANKNTVVLWGNGPDDGYFFQKLSYHLLQAERAAELRDLLKNFSWLQTKLNKLDINALISDYELVFSSQPNPDEPDESLKLIYYALYHSKHELSSEKDQLPEQLYGRLMIFNQPAIENLREEIKKQVSRPWLRPITASMMQANNSVMMVLTTYPVKNPMEAVTLVPKKWRALSAGNDASLIIWDIWTGERLGALLGHNGPVWAVAVDVDERFAVSGSQDQTVKVWDLENHTLELSIDAHDGPVSAVAITPDGQQIVSASHDTTIKLWDLKTGAYLRTFPGHNGGINALALIADGSKIVSGSYDGTIAIWNLNTGELEETFQAHPAQVSALAISSDCQWLVTASFDHTLKLWDLAQKREVFTFIGHEDVVSAVALGPLGRMISASWDKTLRVWDLGTRELVGVLEGHSYKVTGVAITPDGRRAVSSSGDTTLNVWDLGRINQAQPVPRIKGFLSAIAVTSDNRYAITRSNTPDGRILFSVWDLDSTQLVHTANDYLNYPYDNLRLFVDDYYQIINMTDSNSNRIVRIPLGGWRDRKNLFLPDGQLLEIRDLWTNVIRVIHPGSPEDPIFLSGHRAEVYDVAITPDGKTLLTGSNDHTLGIWETATGKNIAFLPGHTHEVWSVGVAADGRTAVSCSDDRTVIVWDLAEKTQITRFLADGALTACAISPDGQTVVTGDEAGRLHILRLER